MKISHPSHPFWKLARLSIVCITAIAFLALNYNQGLVPKDFGTVLGILTSLGVFDYIKKQITHYPEEDNASN